MCDQTPPALSRSQDGHISRPLKLFTKFFLSLLAAVVSHSQNNVCLLANRFIVINTNTACIGHELHSPPHIAGYHSTIMLVMQQHCLCQPSDAPTLLRAPTRQCLIADQHKESVSENHTDCSAC